MYIIGADIGVFFSNLTEKSKEWGGYFLMFLGVVLIIWGVVGIVKAFVSHGRGQVNWLMTIGMILVGGFLLASGNNMAEVIKFANYGNDTLKDLAGSSGGGTPTPTP